MMNVAMFKLFTKDFYQIYLKHIPYSLIYLFVCLNIKVQLCRNIRLSGVLDKIKIAHKSRKLLNTALDQDK